MRDKQQEELYPEVNLQSVMNAVDVINSISDITSELGSKEAVLMGVQTRIVACHLIEFSALLLRDVPVKEAVKQVSLSFKD